MDWVGLTERKLHMTISSFALVRVDSRKRVCLGTMAHHDQYLVREEANGTIIFEPAVVVTASERALLADKHLMATLEQVNAHPERRRTRPR